MGAIRISRDSGWADSLRNYKVVVNGKTIGMINDGETKEFDLEDGEHKLW
ncbi:hypothetical protein ACFLX5_00450 [Chloroflexota bacterium]